MQLEIEIEAIKRKKTNKPKFRTRFANLKEDRNEIYAKMEIRERCSWQYSSGKTEIEDLNTRLSVRNVMVITEK
jgi:hypothetical protein